MLKKTNAIVGIVTLALLFGGVLPVATADEALDKANEEPDPAKRCEYYVDPLGVDVPRPNLSWELGPGAAAGERRGLRQAAYQVRAASTLEGLERGQRRRVTDPADEPFEGLRITAYDADLLMDDLLGSASTDVAGDFEITSYGADGAPGGVEVNEDLSSKTIFQADQQN